MANEPVHLFGDYFFREVSPQQYRSFIDQNWSKVFSDPIHIVVDDTLTDDEKAKINLLGAALKDLYTQYILIFKNDEIIGWHTGRQIKADLYSMGATGILKEYQNRGIYSALLPKLLELYHDKGFQKISSRHHASNSRVLVPKLKAGFVITGFEIDERYGLFVVLSYIYNEKRMKAYKFFTGAMRPDEEIKKYL